MPARRSRSTSFMPHARGGGEHATAGGEIVFGQAERRLGEHDRGRAVARVAVGLDDAGEALAGGVAGVDLDPEGAALALLAAGALARGGEQALDEGASPGDHGGGAEGGHDGAHARAQACRQEEATGAGAQIHGLVVTEAPAVGEVEEGVGLGGASTMRVLHGGHGERASSTWPVIGIAGEGPSEDRRGRVAPRPLGVERVGVSEDAAHGRILGGLDDVEHGGDRAPAGAARHFDQAEVRLGELPALLRQVVVDQEDAQIRGDGVEAAAKGTMRAPVAAARA